VAHIRVSIAKGQSGAQRWVSLPVDSGAKYLTLPRRVLVSLGIRPIRRESFPVGDGRPLVRDVGIAVVRYRGTSTRTQVIFGEPGDMCILGVVALKELCLELNPRSGRVRKSEPCLLPFRTAQGT